MKKFVITLFSLIAISATAAINPNTRPKSSGTYYSEQYRMITSLLQDLWLSMVIIMEYNL